MSASNPLEEALKLAFRAFCADLGTMNPAYRAQELYCPFCGGTCRLSTPRPACGCERGCMMCAGGGDSDEELVTWPDELCPNGCMKMAPQVTLHAGDAVEGGTIATFQADGAPLVRPRSALAVGDRVRRLPLDNYQSEGIIESFRSAGNGERPLALVRFAQASYYPVLVSQAELVKV